MEGELSDLQAVVLREEVTFLIVWRATHRMDNEESMDTYFFFEVLELTVESLHLGVANFKAI